MKNVVCFKLISGDEVVGDLIQESSDYFVMGKPFIVIAGQQGIGLIPVMITARPDDNITFYYNSLATKPQPVVGDFERHYTEKTSGIQLLS